MTSAPKLPPLAPDAFTTMVQAAHGHPPFPWQQRLAAEAAAGHWPDAIDIPTGLGKTTTLDAAVHALAEQTGRPLGERTAPLRIWYVIDRRLVVDDVAAHAQQLAAALAQPTHPDVATVAERLRAYSGLPPGEAPLQVVSLRGGQLTNLDWATRLDLPMVIVSTIDQFGSRLLLRGYGVSQRRWPLHAAFAGTDSLILLDEAHLAAPLQATLQRLADVPAEQPVTPPPRVVVMSATPRAGATRVLRLEPQDRAHRVVAQRVRARKLVELHPPITTRADLEGRLAKLAKAATGRPGVRVVGVVANRVSVARAVRERLAGLDPDADRDGRILLLTARQRPIERPDLIDAVRTLAGAARTRSADDKACYLVATQTVEVGVDLDLDALVTESCPLDALIQRVGRLDRRGDFVEFQRHIGIAEPEPAKVDVVFCKQLDAAGTDRTPPTDRVYGAVNEATWQWLTSQHHANGGTLNLGIAGQEQIPAKVRAHLASGTKPAPVVTPAHLRAWVHTSPPPALSPQVAPFLHGIAEPQGEVHLVWRADLTDDPERWAQRVQGHPPGAHELLPLPLWEARRWLAGDQAALAADADLDHLSVPPDGTTRQPSTAPPCAAAVVVRDGHAELLDPAAQPASDRLTLRQLAAGEVIVCPAAAGGLDRYGWNPASRDPVRDVADNFPDHPAGARLRLDRDLLAAPDIAVDAGQVTVLLDQAVAAAEDIVGRTYEQARDDLALLLDDLKPLLAPPLGTVAGLLAAAGARLEWQLDPAGGRVIVAARPTRRWAATGTDPDASSLTKRVLLRAHSDAVADRARTLARHLGLPAKISEAVELAARHHDDGKAHPVMQVWLHGVDPDRRHEVSRTGEVLAKSDTPYLQRAATRRIARVPAGWRHEAISAALLRHATHLEDGGVDRELVAHLAGAHHGHARPLFPGLPAADADDEPVHAAIAGRTVTVHGNPLQGLLDDGWVEAFEALNRRYGPWGLALLEGLVISADIACSQEGT